MVRKILIFIFTATLSGLFVFPVSAYEIGTHAFLTKEIVEFYNKNFPDKKIPEDLSSYLVDGSRREDNVPRYFNHFYDPVNDRGLANGIYRGQKSKDWAQDTKGQNKLVYKIVPATVASILTATQLDKIQPVFSKTNFTWQKAIDLYARGELEQSLFALGHIIHLIEDASVPDHTRNDAHPPFDDGGSPYENWTERFSLENPDKDVVNRLQSKKPILLSDLNSYFDGMAKYSNNYFYSKDSIENYKNPQFSKIIEESDLPPGYVYGAYEDDFGQIRLILGKTKHNFSWKEIDNKSQPLSNTQLDDTVISDYWFRLSTKSVQYGAGLVNLFFQEAEKAKAKYELAKAQKPYMARLIDGFGAVFGNKTNDVSDDGFNLAASVPFGQEGPNKNTEQEDGVVSAVVEPTVAPTESSSASNESEPTPKPESESKAETPLAPSQEFPQPQANTTPQSPTSEAQSAETPTQLCSFNTSQTSTHQGAIINELAWMGTTASANDEWIELKNISGGNIDLSGWQLLDMSEQIKIVFGKEDKRGTINKDILAGGLYLLERTDDTSVPSVSADYVYTGVLSDTGEGLRLFNSNCDLIDEVFAAPDWPAGDKVYKRTMERASDFSWRNYSDDSQNGIYGTPKAENSFGTAPVSYAGGGGFSSGGSSSNNNTSTNENNSPSSDNSPSIAAVNHIVISEIQAGTDANGAEDEFVELYNPTDQAINLVGWALKKKSSSGSESNLVSSAAFSGSIASKSFFLITHVNYRGSKTADLVYSANSNNLAYTNNSAVLYDASGIVVDEVTYTEIAKNQSLERKASVNNACATPWDSGEYLGNGCDTDSLSDWELRAAPNPQNTQSLSEPRGVPAAVQDFNVSYSSSNLELTFNWTEDPALSYQIADISGVTPIILAQNATSNFTKEITEIGREYKYEILAIDQGGLASSPAQFTINVPSFLESISWFSDSRNPSQYLMDLKWDDYPFVSIKLPHLVSGEEAENNWHVAVFYYNQEAPVTDDIFWIDYTDSLSYKSWGLIAPNGFKIKYPNCFGSSRETAGAALILPDTIDQCSGLAGNHASYALNWDQLEDNHLLLNVDGSNFVNAAPMSSQDFITVAYYAYQPGYEPNNYGLGLVAIDKTKYYLQDSAPIHQPPTVPDNIDFDFDADTSLLKIFWERSADPDTLDNLISYEISYSDAENSDTSNVLNTSEDYLEILVEPNVTYNFELRAVDDFGNFSEVVTENYSVPDIPLPYNLTDIKWGRSVDLSLPALNLEFEEYPFMDFDSPGAMIFFLNQMPPANYSFLDDDYRNGLQIGGNNSVLELSYQPCDYNGTWNNKVNAAGLVINNDECPVQSHLAMSKLLLAKLSGEDTSFTPEVINQREFSDSDYITVGFYQLGERDINGAAYFTNTVNYNKKIYFQP